MGVNAVNLGKYYRKKGYSLEAKRAHAVLPEIPETTSDPIGLGGVGITRCQGCERTAENSNHSYCTCGRNRIGKPWHHSQHCTLFTASWQFFFLITMFRVLMWRQACDSDRHLGGDTKQNSL